MKYYDITHHDPNERKRWPLFAGLCFLVIILINLAIPASAQVIKHHSYTTYFNPKLKCPDSVSWNLTPAMVLCTPPKRIDKFAQDKSIPNSPTPADFTNSHYDKGHLFSFDDAACDDIDRVECFYMTNMLAQLHPFNAGDWKVLEVQERVWAKTKTLHIIAGGLGSIGTLKSGENIPKYMWKAILMDGIYTCWIMPNSNSSHGHPYTFWVVKKADFDKQTSLKL